MLGSSDSVICRGIYCHLRILREEMEEEMEGLKKRCHSPFG